MSDLAALTAVYECTRAIGLRDHLDEILDEVLAGAQDLIGFEHSALMLYEPVTDTLCVSRLIGYGDRAEHIRRLDLAVGEGLSGWAYRHKQSVRVGDVTRDPRYVEGLRLARSNLAVPLMAGGQVAGIINVESEQYDAFSAEHEKLLTVLGTHAALAIVAHQAQADLRIRIEQLRAINRISRLASEGGNLGVTINAMAEVAQELIPEGQCAILLLDEDRKVLRVAAGQGYQADVPYLEIPLGHGVTGRCAETGVPQLIHDLNEIPADQYIPGVPHARSEVAVPLLAEGRTIGVLNAESSHPGAFTQDHVQMLTMIGRQAAIVIRSAQLQHETRRLAITDGLTGLYNRRHFSQQLDENLRRADRYDEPMALILLDVDLFKSVNDGFGHLAGDRALQAISNVLLVTVRESDLVARIGGEEFVVLLMRANQGLAMAVAERLRAGIESLELSEPTGQIVGLTASLGVAFFPDDGPDQQSMMHAADRALYQAKSLGRNRIVATYFGSEGHELSVPAGPDPEPGEPLA